MTGTTRSTGAAIVVVNYGSHELIERNFRDFNLDFGEDGVTVVVVDNFRDTASSSAVAEVCARSGWELVANARNVGFGAGVNAGAARALALGADVLLLANPDLELGREAATALIELARADPMRAVSPVVRRLDGSVWFGGAQVLVEEGRTTTRPNADSAAPGGWLTGACIALSFQLWTLSGGFDEDYFLYWEDVDFSWRITAAGGSLEVREELSVLHDVGGTQGGSGKSPVYVYYNCRNRLLFAARHLDGATRSRWRRSSLRYGRAVALRAGRRAFLRNPARLSWAVLSGTWHGLQYR